MSIINLAPYVEPVLIEFVLCKVKICVEGGVGEGFFRCLVEELMKRAGNEVPTSAQVTGDSISQNTQN